MSATIVISRTYVGFSYLVDLDTYKPVGRATQRDVSATFDITRAYCAASVYRVREFDDQQNNEHPTTNRATSIQWATEQRASGGHRWLSYPSTAGWIHVPQWAPLVTAERKTSSDYRVREIGDNRVRAFSDCHQHSPPIQRGEYTSVQHLQSANPQVSAPSRRATYRGPTPNRCSCFIDLYLTDYNIKEYSINGLETSLYKRLFFCGNPSQWAGQESSVIYKIEIKIKECTSYVLCIRGVTTMLSRNRSRELRENNTWCLQLHHQLYNKYFLNYNRIELF